LKEGSGVLEYLLERIFLPIIGVISELDASLNIEIDVLKEG